MNVYEGEPFGDLVHGTRADADRLANNHRIACICIDLSQHHEGEGLT